MKKLLILGALAGAALLLFGSKKDDATTIGIGFNPDGTRRSLTDAETKVYASRYPDLVKSYDVTPEAKAYCDSVSGGTDVFAYLKWHWLNHPASETIWTLS